MITVKKIIEEFKAKNIQNTKLAPTAIEDYLKKNIEFKTYIPFMEKKRIAEMVIKKNMIEENGIKKVEPTGQFIGFVIAMLVSHTNLEINAENPIEDYDMLSEYGLLEVILAQFEKDYAECDIVLKMVLASEMEDNNLNMIVAKFLDNILDKLDGVGDGLKDIISNIDINSLLGGLKMEDLAHLKGFLDTFNK
jgi:hypothetical protein